MKRNYSKVKGIKQTPEQRAETARRNGAKNAGRTQEGYPKAELLPVVESNDYDFLPDMYDPRAKYSPAVKLAAVAAYFATGTCRGAERLVGVSHQTISEWKSKSQWWLAAYSKVKKDKQDELDATLTNLIDSAFSEAEDRILNGDEYINPKGKKKRKKMSGRDLVTAGAIMVDKRAIIRGDPTSITSKTNQVDLLKQLGDKFTEIAKEHLDKTVIKQIEPT